MSQNDQKIESFSSRWGLIVSVLGIAVGTGNIWRFPRIAAQAGGPDGAGAFLVAWVVFLFIWSIPLIIAEYALGRNGRKGTIGSFVELAGEKFAWMGTFVGFVATAIMFYYSVVTGWCIYYFFISASQPLPANIHQATVIWNGFQNSSWPVICLAISTITGGFIVAKGISSIEKVNKVLIPLLVLILIISLIKALTLANSTKGIDYLFTPDWSMLSKPRIWLEALTQNAWDTGAGWGLIMTYAAYMKKKDAVTISSFQTGIGNNLVSLTAAIIIFSTVFGTLSATMSAPQILQIMKTSGPASTGLTFMWLPQLFLKMPAGRIFATLFFLALTFAAFSSLISMIELAARNLVDMGIKRIKATVIICVLGFFLGLPSALDLKIFENQDFVWGIGLMISGAFIAYIIIRHNVFEFRNNLINTSPNDWVLGKWWDIIIKYIVPIEVVVLLTWWIYQSAAVFAPHTWYNPFDTYSVATCLVQWFIAIIIFYIFNKKLANLTSFDWSASN
jgi:NSS family neurotransmitter:Na+ symporter